jgi:hypothetical protein
VKLKFKSALAGLVTVAIAGGGLLVAAGAASAAPTAPPWEPDPNAQAPFGSIVLYDAAGHVLTGGTNLSHIADFAAATTPVTSGSDAGATKANLIFALPDHTKNIGTWTTGSASASTSFPNATAPAPIQGPGFANPLVTLGATDANLAAFVGGVVPDTTTGYANMIEVRLKDTGPGTITSGTNYWETDIAYNNGTTTITTNGVTLAPGSWAVVAPVVVTTTTSLTLSPSSSPQPHATPIGLSSTVTPAANGTVQFFDGTTALGTPQPVTTTTPTATLATNPADGSHSYSAVFTPTGGVAVQGSTSPTVPMTILPPQTGTTTALSANPTSAPQFQPIVLTANITEADAPATAGLAGSVQYFDGASSLGTQSTNDGTAGEYKFTTSTLNQGTHSITATFTPTSTSYAKSTSAAVTVTVTAPTCPGVPDPSGATCTSTSSLQVSVSAGSLTITTPYTAANPFVLPAMTLNSTGTLLSSTARFPAATDPQIVVHSSLAGDPNWTVSVSATDLITNPANTTPISGTGLGLTGGTLLPTPVFPGSVSFTANPAHDPTTGTPGDGNHGLKGGPFTFAQSSGGGNGSAAMFGTLTLLAPSQTQAGTYNGTITFTVG